MKNKVHAMTAVAFAIVVASCGSNSSDTETTTTKDTGTIAKVEPVTNPPVSIEVPVNIKTNFETKYPTASNIRWEYHRPDMEGIEWGWTGWPTMDTADYYTRFVADGTDYWAWYDDQGNWVGTVNVVTDHASLPAPVNSTINSQYNGYTISSVSRENDKNRTAYEVSLEKGDDKVKILIDENGKVMKKKTMTGDSKTKEKMNPKDSVM